MTVEEFRAILLGMEGAFEGSHHGHADFRVKKGIFASLSPDEESGVLRLPAGVVTGFKVVSKFGGMEWVRFPLSSVSVDDVEGLVLLAWEARR